MRVRVQSGIWQEVTVVITTIEEARPEQGIWGASAGPLGHAGYPIGDLKPGELWGLEWSECLSLWLLLDLQGPRVASSPVAQLV